MNDQLKIPKKINVGFQERTDTYSMWRRDDLKNGD